MANVEFVNAPELSGAKLYQCSTFRERMRLKAASDYVKRKSEVAPFANVPCLRKVCSNLVSDRQRRVRLASDIADYHVKAYDPSQQLRRINFLKRRPMLIAAQPASEHEDEVLGIDLAKHLPPKIERVKRNAGLISVFEPKPFVLHRLPVSNKGPLSQSLPSIKKLPNVGEEDNVQSKDKPPEFSIFFPKVLILDEHLRGVEVNAGMTTEPYSGPPLYEPRPKTPNPNPYPKFFPVRTLVDDAKFRTERLDQFRFPVEPVPMREFLNEGQTWFPTHIKPEPKWLRNDYLVKAPPKMFPKFEDVSFSRYPRPRTPYSTFLSEVAGELNLEGPFDDNDKLNKVVDDWAEQNNAQKKAQNKREIKLKMEAAAREVRELPRTPESRVESRA